MPSRSYRLLAPTLAVALTALALTTAHANATTTAGTTNADRLAALAAKIREHLAGSTGHRAYQVDIAGVGRITYRSTAQSAPASNEKLLTAMAAFDQLGTGFRYRTVVGGQAPVIHGVLAGPLIIRGSGDPTLRMGDLRALARALYAEGLRRVTGHLVVVDRRYAHDTVAPGWKRSWLGEETGPVSAFTVGRNSWRGGAAFLRNPAPYNAARWRTALGDAHIRINASTIVGRSQITTVLASHASAPLAEILRRTLKVSDNFTAEMTLREIGAHRNGYGSRKTGRAAVSAEASTLKTTLGTVIDGSGLSWMNRESPHTFVRWLNQARSRPAFPTLYASLPVSCGFGTLEHRMCGPRLAGKVHAKTGTLDHVSSLSGFTTTSTGQQVTFSFLLSGVHDLTQARRHIDAAVGNIVRASFPNG